MIKALAVILKLKIDIEMEVSVIRMMYNIIHAYVSYDFIFYLLGEMKRSLSNLNNDEFQHSSYIWWLIVDQHIEYFIGKDLKPTPLIFVNSVTPIDLRLPYLMKKHVNAYSFSEHFAYPTLKILIGKFLPWLSKEVKDELKVSSKDWYFLKDNTMVNRYGFFDTPFLFPKHPLEVLFNLEMTQ